MKTTQKVDKEVIKFMRAVPELTPFETEEMLEYMQDKDMLSKKGDALKHAFWETFWKETKK